MAVTVVSILLSQACRAISTTSANVMTASILVGKSRADLSWLALESIGALLTSTENATLGLEVS